MQPHRHPDLVAVRGSIEVRVCEGREATRDAIALLDRAEDQFEAPLVDEAERVRLEELADGATRADHWHSLLARDDAGQAVGYAGIILPPDADGDANGRAATGDIAVLREAGCQPGLTALLSGAEQLALRHGADRAELWVRHATGEDIRCATDAGYAVHRRLAVLGRGADPLEVPDIPDTRIRAFDPSAESDAAAVLEVLVDAYGDGPDGGWTGEQLDERMQLDWFEPADLLVAEAADGEVLGIHWTKRRSEAVGEVYNLAVHTRGRGRGLGRALLRAGVSHLAEIGCREVLLWVDLSNRPAVQLYLDEGFTLRWEDLAFTRRLHPTLER